MIDKHTHGRDALPRVYRAREQVRMQLIATVELIASVGRAAAHPYRYDGVDALNRVRCSSKYTFLFLKK
ncbi:MAG: hypothetical protein HOH33_08665 [Verrucomicrobia bacterium]|jgi:hypothetical protein|nr:hypothetical protein [Verrucomicrobiota bacterium]